jgi:hypothetical protein
MDSRYFSTDDLLMLLVGLAVALVLGVLAGTALLRLSLRWIAQVRAGFLRCGGALLVGAALGAAASSTLMALLTMAARTAGVALHRNPGWGLVAVSSLSGFALTVLGLAVAVQWLVPRGDGSRIAFKPALAVAATATGLWTVAYAACIAVLLLALGGVPGVSR